MEHFLPPAWITIANKFDDDHGATRLSRRAARGEVVRVRRGLYLPTSDWETLKPWQRYRTLIQAVNDSAQSSPVFARESAANVLGLPVLRTPGDVHCLQKAASSGGRSEYGVRRHKPLPGDPEPWHVDGLLATPLVETARDLAAVGTFAQGLAALDRLLLAKPFPAVPYEYVRPIRDEEVLESLARLGRSGQRQHVQRVLHHANYLSGSPGESWSRAIMIQHGFPEPVLQKRFSDSRGNIGQPDFDWEEYRLLGEFDGHEKYSRQKYLRGQTPADVVIAEKNRENRLRALGYNVVRWEWADLRSPERLIRLLHDAGLPHSVR